MNDTTVPVIIGGVKCKCEIGPLFPVSSVRHKNHCPVKKEAIARLHLTEDNPYVKSGC